MARTILPQFEFDRDLAPDDVGYLLQQGTASAKQQTQPHRLRALQGDSRIKAWLSVGRPSLLLVNGNAASQLDSTAEFFSAKITNTLMYHVSQPSRSIDIVPLAYFRGQHQDYQSDVAASPEALAKSLLAQLVNTHKDLEERDLQECLENTVPGDVGSIRLCS